MFKVHTAVLDRRRKHYTEGFFAMIILESARPTRVAPRGGERITSFSQPDRAVHQGCCTVCSLNNILWDRMLISASSVQHACIVGFGVGEGGVV
jgi:hypothetical protein